MYQFMKNEKIRRFAGNIEAYLSSRHQYVYNKFFLMLKSYMRKKITIEYTKRKQQYSDDSLYWSEKSNKSIDDILVSIIVPNFNHGKYLKQRLESIYSQTYKNFEVILLDDCSIDNSRDILQKYKEKYPSITVTCFNDSNSGSVFQQWKKGLSMAKGDYVWIAESDDWCDNDFLEKMLNPFKDEAVLLAFSRTFFMQDNVKINDSEAYLVDIDKIDWSKSFSISAYNLVREAFGIRNIIPNVSSVIFRNLGNINSEVENLWNRMMLCGDWLFYLDIIKGGIVSYVHDTVNYYRVHSKSTSLKVQKKSDYYIEHDIIANFIANNYDVAEDVHIRHFQELRKHYISYYKGNNIDELEKWFDVKNILENNINYKPTILMCIYSFQIGGGETFPIILANEMKRQGYAVAVCNFNLGKFEAGIRNLLHSDIPCFNLETPGDILNIYKHLGGGIIHSHHAMIDELIRDFFVDDDTAKHVITLHGMYESMESGYITELVKKLDASNRNFVYISEKNLNPFISNDVKIDQRFYHIGNGLEFSSGNPISRESLNIPENAFVFCVISRAIPQKGWKKAIEAIKKAREISKKNLHLLLVGDGPVYKELLGNVDDYIHLVGFQKNVRDYYATSDMGLLPSEFKGESFPLTVIDCLFTGKPIIVTDIGESKNMITAHDGDTAGVVINTDDNYCFDINDMIKAMIKAENSASEYDRWRFCINKVIDRFFIENVVKEYLKVYMAALNIKHQFIGFS